MKAHRKKDLYYSFITCKNTAIHKHNLSINYAVNSFVSFNKEVRSNKFMGMSPEVHYLSSSSENSKIGLRLLAGQSLPCLRVAQIKTG